MASGRDLEKLQRPFEGEDENLAFVALDVTNEEQAKGAVDEAVRKFGRIDVLFDLNNGNIIGGFSCLRLSKGARTKQRTVCRNLSGAAAMLGPGGVAFPFLPSSCYRGSEGRARGGWAGFAPSTSQQWEDRVLLHSLFPTSLVGSYAQPEWLIDRKKLAGRFPPRVRAKELWRIAPEWLEEAQDDATLLAIRDQERAGLDIITDGEMRRESYSNRFATALEGVDIDNPGIALDRSGHPNPVPCVVGKVRRKHPVEVRDVQFLRANTERRIKMTVPGPFTMSQQAQNSFYDSEETLAMDYAAAVNEEIRDLFAAGADIVQIDEPYMQARPEKARAYGLKALNRALDGIDGETAVHICFGYAAIIHERPSGYSFLAELAQSSAKAVSIETAQSRLDCSILEKLPDKKIILGVLDLSSHEVETPETVAGRVRRALPHISADRVVVAPDCGLKYLPRDVAYGKMKAMADGAAIVRAEGNASGITEWSAKPVAA